MEITVCKTAFLSSVSLTNRLARAGSQRRSGRAYACARTAEQNGDVNTARTAVVTGATGGIGAETCRGLARKLPDLERLILHCRKVDAGEKLASELMKERKNLDVRVVQGDLSDSESVLSSCEEMKKNLDSESLDLLVCNAGIMACPLNYGTLRDGQSRKIELQFLVNHIAHGLMSLSLLPLLKNGESKSRIVYVSSLAVALAATRQSAPLLSEKTEEGVKESGYTKFGAYADSKVGMSLFAKGLARNTRGEGVECVSLHPGVVMTDLIRHLVPAPVAKMTSANDGVNFGHRVLGKIMGLKLPGEGAALSLELSTVRPGQFENGGMYVEVGGKKIDDKLFPLLQVDKECDVVYNDVLEIFKRLTK